MAENNLFAAPTPDELANETLFAPPSSEELGVAEPISQLEAAARGGAQGATFGFADELEGMGKTAYEALSGNLDVTTQLADKYRQERDLSRERLKQAEQEHPITTMGSQIAGGLVTGGLIPGMQGTAAMAAGGLAGLGTSDADLTQGNLENAAVDIGTGMALGGAVGGLAKGAQKLLKNAPAGVEKMSKIAAEQAEKAANKAPSAIGPFEVVAGMAATQNPAMAIPAIVAKKGLEIATGKSTDELSKIATSKTLSALSNTLKEASQPGAKGVAASILNLSQDPNAATRAAGLATMLANPEISDTISTGLSITPKDVAVKTPRTSTGGVDMSKARHNRQYDEQRIIDIQSKIGDDADPQAQQVKAMLEAVKNKDVRSRNAAMFALEQNPAYRQILRKLEKKDGTAE